MACLYLFPTLLADVDYTEVLPIKNIDKVLTCKNFIVEEIRTARRFLRKIGYKYDFDKVNFFLLNEHTDKKDIANYLIPIEKGEDMFLMSESGLPCIADPGAACVRIAQKKQIKVIPLVGPSSIYMSLMCSGFNGQNFAFNGYLPVKKDEREKKLKLLERRVYKENQTQIFIEAPYRNEHLLESMFNVLNNESLLCIASEITSENQSIITKSISEWKKEKDIQINKLNTIFLLYKQ